MINIKSLSEIFDIETIYSLITLGRETIHDNIKLIQNGLEQKNVEKMYRGSHTLKSLGFLGMDTIMKYANTLTEMSRNKNYEEVHIDEYCKQFDELRYQIQLFENWYCRNVSNELFKSVMVNGLTM